MVEDLLASQEGFCSRELVTFRADATINSTANYPVNGSANNSRRLFKFTSCKRRSTDTLTTIQCSIYTHNFSSRIYKYLTDVRRKLKNLHGTFNIQTHAAKELY